MKKFKYLLILLSLIFLTSCESLYQTLDPMDASFYEGITEYDINQDITVNIRGYINKSKHLSAKIGLRLYCNDEWANIKDLTSTEGVIDKNCILLDKDILGDINLDFSFKITESGNYTLLLEIYAPREEYPKAYSDYEKNLTFTVK